MALDYQFDPIKAFQALDSDEDLVITSNEIVAFLKQSFIRVSIQDADLLIREYDANQDENLDLDEFLKFVLPSTNKIQHDLALERTQRSYHQEQPISDRIIKALVEHIEMEINFQKKRNEIKR